MCLCAAQLLKPLPKERGWCYECSGNAPAWGMLSCRWEKSHPDHLRSTGLKVLPQTEGESQVCLLLGWREDLNMPFPVHHQVRQGPGCLLSFVKL